jgi:hypothetical protein
MNRFFLSLTAILLVCAAGCGPVATTRHRWELSGYDANENVQEKDGITIERHKLSSIPEVFFANVQACDANLVPLVDSNGPVMERISFMPGYTTYYKMTLTNNTEHVVRLNRAVFRLFDPAGNQYDPADYDELQTVLLAKRPCPTTNRVIPQLKLVKLFSRNVEVVPKTNFDGYLLFRTNGPQSGTWRLALYDIPVNSDEAGNVTKTTRFEMRSIQKHYIDHYIQDSTFAQPRLQTTEEVQ